MHDKQNCFYIIDDSFKKLPQTRLWITHTISILYCSDLYLCSIETRFSWMRAQSKQDVDTLRNFITKRIVTITMKRLALATVLLGKVCSLHLPPLVIQLKSNSHKPTTLASVPVVRLSASYANWMLTCVLHTHTHYLSFSRTYTLTLLQYVQWRTVPCVISNERTNDEHEQ